MTNPSDKPTDFDVEVSKVIDHQYAQRLIKPDNLASPHDRPDKASPGMSARQDQPKDKERAQQPGLKEQQDAAKSTPESPGEPANGE